MGTRQDLCQAWGCVRRAAAASGGGELVATLADLDAHFGDMEGLTPSMADAHSTLSTESALLAADAYLRRNWAALRPDFQRAWAAATTGLGDIAINSSVPVGVAASQPCNSALA